ncbi:unnamed protein product [Mucor hiemalis]
MAITVSDEFSLSLIVFSLSFSRYAGTILAPEEIIANNKSNTKVVSVTQSSFYNKPSTRKTCSHCSSSISSNAFVQDGSTFCKECHLQLFNKGKCPTCLKLVSERDVFIEYSTSVWHAECFTCFNCKIPLEANPLIDLKNRPCCEPCFMNQAHKKVHANNRKSVDPLYPIHSRSSRRPRVDQDLFRPAIVTPPRTPSPQESTSTNRRASALARKAPTTPTTPTTPIVSSPSSYHSSIPNPSHSTNRSLSQRPCHYCHEPLGDASQKKTKVPIGEGLYAWFHKSCFLCSKCHLPFQKNGECATDGHSFYHPNCSQSPGKSCFGCKKAIGTDAFQFNDKMYHFDCFKCYGNGCKIGVGQPIFEVGKRPFCQHCHELSQTATRPKLGGSKTCPRCKSSISVMEDTPGPLATRWHKKCLSCTHCHKQLDSAAKMKEGSEGESLVYCRACF